jgi:hypothetical protein
MKMNSRMADWTQAAYFGGATLILGWMLWDHSGWVWSTDMVVVQYELSTFFRFFHLTGGYVITAILFAFSLMAANLSGSGRTPLTTNAARISRAASSRQQFFQSLGFDAAFGVRLFCLVSDERQYFFGNQDSPSIDKTLCHC